MHYEDYLHDGMVINGGKSPLICFTFFFFLSHNSKTTSWLDPRTHSKEVVSKTECKCVHGTSLLPILCVL